MQHLIRTASVALVAIAWANPAFAGPPFLSDDPDPTPYQHYEIYLFGNATKTGDDVGGATGIDFNYGATPDLQLTATLPIGYDRPDGGSLISGLGNVELAAKFRFLHQETSGWDVAIFPRLFLPAGSHLGDDHASLLIPLWAGRAWENGSTFGGGGCAINRGGDSQDYCLAGWALTHHFAPQVQVGVELFHQTPDVKHGKATSIAGLGATYDITENLHVLGYFGAGLENTAETGRGTGYASVLFTF